MSIPFLLDHFEQLFDSEEKIKNFDSIILQLAVSGRLNTQDPSDEPASDLLKRIQTEKEALIKAGKLKAQKLLPPVDEAEAPFEIPPSWVWCKLSEIVLLNVGKTPSRNDNTYWNTGDFNWVSIADLKHQQIINTTRETISNIAHEKVFKGNIVPKGSLLMSFKLTIGKISIVNMDCYHNEAIVSLFPIIENLKKYLFLALPNLDLTKEKSNAIKGATLNRAKLENISIPLPPLDEQKRIVAKVDELLSKSAEIKAYFSEKNKMRVKLNQSLLHHLEKSKNHEAFKKNFNLITSHFNDLYDNPENLKALRQTILQLAVSGRLNTQDPSDEPASDLLKRIQAEKQALIKAGKLKAQKPLPPVDEAEAPFEIPPSWVWTRLGEVTYNLGQKLPMEPFSYIDIASIDNAKGCISDNLNVISPDMAPSRARKIVNVGSVLYSTVRPYLLNIAIVDREINPLPIASTGFSVFHTNNFLLEKYLFHYLRSNCFVKYVESKMIGVAYPAINDSNLLNGFIPLPPLDEQKRIVAKVDELMALCDALEVQLNEQQPHATALLNSLVHELIGAGASA